MIREFYKGRTILLTGGTGFYGQALVAKILRDLPGIERLYLLLRPKRQADGRVFSAAERLDEELFARDAFDRFRREDPRGFAAARQKVSAVDCELGNPGMGVAEDIRQQLCAEVDLIIAPGASVVFDEPLDRAIQLNTLGPQELLEFARQCRKEAVYVHVSTAYVSGRLSGSIAEDPLPLDRNASQIMEGGVPDKPFDPEAEIADCQARCQEVHAQATSAEQQEVFRREILAQNHSRQISDKRLAKLMDDRRKRWIERRLIDEGMRRARDCGWNDVYTFTKAMGEQMLVKRRGEVPLAIVRPSITESSLVDPEPGWIFGLKVAEPMIIAYGRGQLPDFPTGDGVVMDLVPIDIVVNTILAAAKVASGDQVRVFHAATSAQSPLTIRQMYEYVRGYFEEHPLRGRDGSIPELAEWDFPSMRRFRFRFTFRYLYPLRISQWMLDRLPGKLAPKQKKRQLGMLEKQLRRLLYFTDLFGPYTTLRCRFEVARSRALFESLPVEEQRIFSMDMANIDWKHYFQQIHLPGLRRFVLKEEQEEDALLREAPEEVGAEEEQWRVEESIETIPDLLRWAGAGYADRVALQVEDGDGWRRFTYVQLQERVDCLAQSWQQRGLQPGEKVLLYAENSPEWVIAYMAASVLGLIVVPLDPQTREEDIWSLIDFTEARSLIASRSCYARLSAEEVAARQAEEENLHFFDLENSGLPFGQPQLDRLPPLDENWHPPVIDPDQVASILFTAGSLIEPRGGMLTHRNFVADLLALAEVHRIHEADQVLSVLPLHHCLEFTGGLLMPMLGGATITYLKAFNSREIFGAMEATGTTGLLAVPRLLKMLGDRLQRLAAQQADGESFPELESLRRLRLLVSGGAPLAGEIFDLFQEFGVTICEGYGLTEAAPIVAVNAPDGVRAGSVGQVLPRQEIAIADANEQGEGEVLVRGVNVMAGYFDQPELTSRTLVDGWLHTGDIGRLDDEGYLYITGRCKNLIVTGAGKNVYPEEVEVLYRDLPHLAELCVLGVRSARTLGEEVHGVAVLERASKQGEEELRQAVLERASQISQEIPSYQRIQHLHIWKRSLPRLDDGEVDRGALLAELEFEKDEEAGLDPSLPPWKREIFRQIAQLAGLSPGGVAARAQVPLDGLMDSLMAVEFAALLETQLEVKLPSLDRSGQTLEQVLERLEPDLTGKFEQLQKIGETGSYWSKTLAPGTDGERPEAPGPGSGRRMLQRGVWWACTPFFRRYFSLEIQGVENLPADRPYLLAANHASHLDAISVLTGVYPHVVHCHLMAAKDYFFRSELRGWLMRSFANAVPFDRYGNFRESLVKARSLVGVRRPLLIFPEGTRSLSGQLQPFKLGIGLLAFELDVPIVPVHISGTYQALPKGKHRPGRHPIRLLFGEPLEMDSFRARADGLSSYEVYREIAEALRRDIERLTAENGG